MLAFLLLPLVSFTVSALQTSCDVGVACGTVIDAGRRTLGDDVRLETDVSAGDTFDYWMLFEVLSCTILAIGSANCRKSRRSGKKPIVANPAGLNIPALSRDSDTDPSVMKIRQERRATMIINSRSNYADGPQQACKILEDMKKKGCPPNVIHYGAAIGVCAKKEFAFDVALELLEDMRQSSVKPDVVCFNAAITSCARSNQCDAAFQLLNEMSDHGLVPELVTVNAVLDACAKAGQEDKARRLLERMPALGLHATVTTYGTVINAVAKAGKWESALQFLDDMDAAGIESTIQCYSAAINACAKSARAKPALEILRRMAARGVTPNQICWSTTINACLKGGQVELALGLLDEMKQAGVPPDDVTYHVLIRDLKKNSAVYRDTIVELQAERARQGAKIRANGSEVPRRLDLKRPKTK